MPNESSGEESVIEDDGELALPKTTLVQALDSLQVVHVPVPKIVKQYNSHIVVDLTGILVTLYKTELKTHKWYMTVLLQMFDKGTSNARLCYQQDCHPFKQQKVN
ncbi:Hypothetical protein CINCED_3A017742 [Cinara cedri]|uniref:Uncharacterized protein n=1 Tax=Cinara cedri TaxID=506608 RepID=A0A5E4NIC8_9HEMI|nr:Hypothetical protein CINCED_3A017742 [Cinara cedri]